MAYLELKSINKKFNTAHIIKDIDLKIQDGEFIIFVGPSGCGKSTLLRLIAGLEEITSGQLLIDDVQVNDLPPVKRGVSMVFQSYALYPHLSIFENIAFPLRVQRRPEAEIKERVHKIAEILHLTDYLQSRPAALSGGQRQRVAIGRTIIRQPKVFLFDEPLSNLDASLRASMRVELSSLHSSLNATMIYVTHDQIEAMTMADRIVVLNEGKIEQVGSPLELYHHPKNQFVASFIGHPKMNFLPVTCMQANATEITVQMQNNQEVTLPIKGHSSLIGKTLTLGIRPEHCSPTEGDYNLSIIPVVVERLGVQTLAYTKQSDNDGTSFCALFSHDVDIMVNQKTFLQFYAQDCHLFDPHHIALKRLQVRQSQEIHKRAV